MEKKHLPLTTHYEKFLNAINTLLVIVIAIVLVSAVCLLFLDIFHMIQTKFTQGLGTVLGSLIIIWVIMELLEAQIDHLNGKKLKASIFVVVGIGAFIRKLFVASLIPDKVDFAYFNLLAIFVLSITYLILRFAEYHLGTNEGENQT
ncbi:MAG: phosphate-starvation-inducible PsiE family protein [Desulfobulbaceae bacterium]|jgi:uncharacterized membrane protein (DUF373 family)|nr:phosphate-starvation-inducible PsiE family protein [Desulfobulbaceae bacterium]